MLRRSAAVLAALWLLIFPALAQQPELITRLDAVPETLLKAEPLWRECELGWVAADALRALSGADVALVNGGDLQNDLSAGPVTREDVERVFAQNRTLALATVCPAELWAILEHSVHRITVDPATEKISPEESGFEGFCHVSGFRFLYDASAPVGQRVQSVTMDDGRALSPEDRETQLVLCAAEDMLCGGWGYAPLACESLEQSQADALEAYVRGKSQLPESDRERILVIGARQNSIVGGFLPKWVLVAGCAVVILLLAIPGLRLKGYKDEFGTDDEKWARGYRTGTKKKPKL